MGIASGKQNPDPPLHRMSPAILADGKRSISSCVAVFRIMRISGAPTQACLPRPRVNWPPRLAAICNTAASANLSGSLLAALILSINRSPLRMGMPLTFKSVAAMRNKISVKPAYRNNSSTALPMSWGSARSRVHSVGFCSKASQHLARSLAKVCERATKPDSRSESGPVRKHFFSSAPAAFACDDSVES